jgi:hypothetical protein
MSASFDWNAAGAIGTWIGALFAAVIGYLVWRTSKRIEWLTGSMESYQMKQLQLQVKEHADVRLVWWDPTIEPWPYSGTHGGEVKTDIIYLGVPLRRRHKPGK